MGIPELDGRSREDILRLISAHARAYTPEWRFDPEDPDMAGTLAIIYSELFSQTLKRFNRVPEKNMTAFFSSMGTRLLPALTAEGFVRFSLAGDVAEGAPVAAGTPLLADADNDVGSTVFETQDDVLVTPARPEQIFSVCGGSDTIVHSWDGTDCDEEAHDFSLFDWKQENLQSHVLSLSHDMVLAVSGGASLTVELTPTHQRELPREVGETLADERRAVWEYSYGETWQPFSSCKLDGNRLILSLAKQKLPVIPSLQEGMEDRRWIRLRLLPGVKLPPISFRLIRLSAEHRDLLPDQVNASGTDQDIHEFYPFGQQLVPFSEAYFGCEEALVKKGAQVDMTYNLDFVTIPLDYDVTDSSINWKLIMKKSDFRVEEEYDVSIQEVLWEYFNGTGWARLFPDEREADCFNANQGALGQRRTLRFTVPDDMEPVLVNADTGYFIRARAIRIKNLYKLRGNYIVPVMEGLRFSYHYQEKGRLPEVMVTENGMERQQQDVTLFRSDSGGLTPFSFLQEEKAAAYFGFPIPPLGGPIKILFLMGETMRLRPGRLRWEYRGRRGWERLNVVDETEDLRQSGILTLMGGNDFQILRLWGRECCWIRAVDEENCYWGREALGSLPRIRSLCMNAVRVRNVATQEPERFFIERSQKNFTAKLLRDHIYSAQVWVNEFDSLLPQQVERLEETGQAELIRDTAGILREVWVRWEEREDFALSKPNDRHYILDRNRGEIQFSDGINGRIPPYGSENTIEVRYVTGGGTEGNVPAEAINRSSQALGFVSQVENLRPTAGGSDQETVQEAIRRGGRALRHGDRAVTPRDFESLALEATRSLARARCFSNRDENGKARPGWVTLVVLLQDYRAGGELLTNVCGKVSDYICRRCGGNLAVLDHFHVVGPQFLELRVKAELSVREFDQVFAVQEKVRDRLNSFLDPITGNFDGRGWDVGVLPNETQLRNCLSSVPGVGLIRQVSAAAYMDTGSGRVEVELGEASCLPFALPTGGEHEIIIAVE